MHVLNLQSITVALLALLAFQPAVGQGLSVSVADATFQPETDNGVGLLTFNATLQAAQDPNVDGEEGIPPGTQVTLIWSTGDQTARGGINSCGPGVDYLAQSQVALTLSPSFPVGRIDVPICGDTRDEANETFSVALSLITGSATLTRNVVTGTIVDDDPPPVITVGAAQLTEGNAGTTMMALPVLLSRASGLPITANFQTEVTGLTATQAANCAGGADLQSTTGQVSIAEDLDRGQVNVPICGDLVPEAHQTFRVRLTSATNASLGANPTGIGTILNDDSTFSVSDPTVTEPTIGTRSVRFTVSLSSASPHNVSVSYRTVDGTARATGAGAGPWTCPLIDYLSRTGSLPIPAGTTSGFVDVTVCGGDSSSEGNETFHLDLSNPVGTTIADSRGTDTIRTAAPLTIQLP
jgi:hypothetical protein